MKELLVLCFAVAVYGYDIQEMMNKQYALFDFNKDGHVTFDDFHALFNYADTSANGLVSMEEYIKGTGSTQAKVHAIYGNVDISKDGNLDLAETRAAFEAFDTDGDGTISHSEFETRYRMLLAQMGISSQS